MTKLDHKKIERLIKKHYNIDFDFIRHQRSNKMDLHDFHVNEVVDAEAVKRVRRGFLELQAGTLLRMLCKDGHLASGDYTVVIGQSVT